MEPTILIGDRVFVNKLAYDLKLPYTTTHLAKWADPKRGDIVVFYSPEDGTRLIKRVVGIPGDTVGMHNNKLFINGQFVQYDTMPDDVSKQIDLSSHENHFLLTEYLKGKKHALMLLPDQASLNSFTPVTVPQGRFFMLGDNRDNSADSRYFGFVDRNLILGRATTVAISRNDSFIHPRWSRFFKTLL